MVRLVSYSRLGTGIHSVALEQKIYANNFVHVRFRKIFRERESLPQLKIQKQNIFVSPYR